MKFLLYFSDFIVPFTMFYIIVYGFFNHTDVYESFLNGVKEGFHIVIEIAPTMIALLVSIGIFRASGALDSFSDFITPLGKVLHNRNDHSCFRIRSVLFKNIKYKAYRCR